MKNIEEKIKQLKLIFDECQNAEDKYNKIIELGKGLKNISEEFKSSDNRIQGCQSNTYLKTSYQNGTVCFEGTSDALISAGLMYILIYVYNNQTPEAILKTEPKFIHELGIYSSLTPSRSNGMASMLLRMRQEALKILTKQ